MDALGDYTGHVVARTLGIAIVCWGQIPKASGGPPPVTDDPETPGRGGGEINISHVIEKTSDETLMETPLIDVNYGLLENDQWKIEFAVLFLDVENDRAAVDHTRGPAAVVDYSLV